MTEQFIKEGEINLKARELFITDYKDKNGIVSEVVRIKGGVAFDQGFLNECKAVGVKKLVFQEKEGIDYEE